MDKENTKRIGRPPRLVQSLIQKIQDDFIANLSAGMRLPSERALAGHFSASRPSIRMALDVLCKSGVIVQKVGKGTFVARSIRERRRPVAGKSIGISLAHAPSFPQQHFTMSVLAGISDVLRPMDLNLVVGLRSWRWARDVEPAAQFSSSPLLGLFLIEEHPPDIVASLKTLGTRFVAVDMDAREQGIPSFCFDNVAAGAMLAKRLVKLGHRRFASFEEGKDTPKRRIDAAWFDRCRGFSQKLNALGVAKPIPVSVKNRSRYSTALREVRTLLRKPAGERPTAIFLPTNLSLDPFQEIAASLNLSIPGDLSIVSGGHSDSDPQMTCICFDSEYLGRKAAHHLLTLLDQTRSRARTPVLVSIKGRYHAGGSHARAPR